MKPSPRPAPNFRHLLAGGIIVVAALVAYCDSFSGPFVLDDPPSIVDNPTIRHLWPLSGPLSPPRGGGATVEGRPLLNLSLALNYAISGTQVWSYHLVNLLIHILAGLTLFGIVRRTLVGWERSRFREKSVSQAEGRILTNSATDGRAAKRVGNNALHLALAVALIWTVHPLQTGSVTYVIQRAESLMGLFYLLTLYCFIRAIEVERVVPNPLEQAGWYALSVLCCLFGMASKEVMVSAPLMVLLYDRTFVAGSFRAAWCQRRRFYLALAATWILLGILVVRTGNRGGTSGIGVGVGPLMYWPTQFPAVVRYIGLSLWPHPLIFDYGTEWIKSAPAVLPYALIVLALAAGAAWALWRWPVLGFLGFWFFAILAPTSLVTGNRQTMAEQRMYLPLAAVIALLVVGGCAALRRMSGRALMLAAALLAAACCILTIERNQDYRSVVALYADNVAKAPDNAFAQNNLGFALFLSGRTPEAIDHYEEALRLRPDYAAAHNNLGNALMSLGHQPEAVGHFEAAIRLKPDFADAYVNLGTALYWLGRIPEAAAQLEEALRLQPDDAEAHNDLGNILASEGEMPEAIAHYEKALAIKSDYPVAHYNLGNALLGVGRAAEAAAQFQEALRISPDYTQARQALARLQR